MSSESLSILKLQLWIWLSVLQRGKTEAHKSCWPGIDNKNWPTEGSKEDFSFQNPFSSLSQFSFYLSFVLIPLLPAISFLSLSLSHSWNINYSNFTRGSKVIKIQSVTSHYCVQHMRQMLGVWLDNLWFLLMPKCKQKTGYFTFS